MSQRVKEFVRQSGVEVSNSNSNDDNFARELEETMLRKERERAAGFRTPPRQMRPVPRQVQVPTRLQRNLISNSNYEPLRDEFMDVKLGPNNEKMINNILRDFDEPNFESNNVRALLASPLQMTKLNPGMFNATVDSGFGQKDVLVNLKTILSKIPIGKTPIGEGLYVDTREIKGIYGQFKTGFSHTREAGPKGGLNKNFFSAQLMLTVSDDTESKGATVNFYRNGKIRFSGGFVGTNIANQPELIRKFIVDTYTEKQPFFYNPFTYNNLSGQFRINGNFKSLTAIARNAQRYGMTRVSYEPELAPFLYAYFEESKFILSGSGNVQISGAKNPGDMLKAYDFGKNFVQDLNADDQIDVTGVFDKGVKATTKAKAKPKAKAKSPPKRKYSKRILTTNQANALILNSKMCVRMKKSELIDLARRMGVVNFRTKVDDGSRAASKDEICTRIRNKTGKKNITFKNTEKNKNVALIGTGNTFKVGRKMCMDMKKDELLRIAAFLKIKPDEKETKATLCKKIEQVRNNLAKPKPMSPPKPPAPTKRQVQRTEVNVKRNVKKAEVMKKRGLNENSIRKDITKLYGDSWMKRYKPNLNQDVRNMKVALNIINKKNKTGVAFKKDIDVVKKNVVSRWKMERKRELERKYLMNTVSVNGITFNNRNDYRLAAANYIMSKKTTPSNKKMVEYRQYWLKFKANANSNGRPKGINGAVRARVEKV
jgi:TATA-box binding protein (TBP) (component of TFIID and TFIIIB)